MFPLKATHHHITRKILNKIAIKYGIFTGFGVILYLFGFYLYDKTMMRSAGVLWSTMFIYIIGMFMATFVVHRNRKEEESPLPKMIATPFIVFLIANAYYALFFYWIMNVYDPELLKIHQELTHQEMLDFYKGTDMVVQVRKNKLEDYTPTLGATIFQYFKGAIGGFSLALLIGLVIRRT